MLILVLYNDTKPIPTNIIPLPNSVINILFILAFYNDAKPIPINIIPLPNSIINISLILLFVYLDIIIIINIINIINSIIIAIINIININVSNPHNFIMQIVASPNIIKYHLVHSFVEFVAYVYI